MPLFQVHTLAFAALKNLEAGQRMMVLVAETGLILMFPSGLFSVRGFLFSFLKAWFPPVFPLSGAFPLYFSLYSPSLLLLPKKQDLLAK